VLVRGGFCFPLSAPICDDLRRKVLSFPILAIFAPSPPFFELLLQTKDFCHSTLGPPLRDAWAALGPRLGHPRVTQSQTQSQTQWAEGRIEKPCGAKPGPPASAIFACWGEAAREPNDPEWRSLPIPLADYTARFSKILRTLAQPHSSAIHNSNHARTSSLAADMSFATLCLTWFIVQSATHRTDFVFTLLISNSFFSRVPLLIFSLLSLTKLWVPNPLRPARSHM
jgi:hypothetical protein